MIGRGGEREYCEYFHLIRIHKRYSINFIFNENVSIEKWNKREWERNIGKERKKALHGSEQRAQCASAPLRSRFIYCARVSHTFMQYAYSCMNRCSIASSTAHTHTQSFLIQFDVKCKSHARISITIFHIYRTYSQPFAQRAVLPPETILHFQATNRTVCNACRCWRRSSSSCIIKYLHASLLMLLVDVY